MLILNPLIDTVHLLYIYAKYRYSIDKEVELFLSIGKN